MSDLTQALHAVGKGDPKAAEQLLPLVYDQLRQLAAHKLAAEPPDQSLQATALVHEAYLRLVGTQSQPCWDCRGHFFAAAAEAMRRILVEQARRKQSLKHGGGLTRLELEGLQPATGELHEDVLALNEALDRFAERDPTAAQLVQLRYFGGCTLSEAAEILKISPRTAGRLWAYARAWLRQVIDDVSDVPEDV